MIRTVLLLAATSAVAFCSIAVAQTPQPPQAQGPQLPDDIRVCKAALLAAETDIYNVISGSHMSRAQAAILLQENQQFRAVADELRQKLDDANKAIEALKKQQVEPRG